MAADPVAVDGSPQSLLAAEWAVMEAVRRGLGRRIVSARGIVPPMHLPWLPGDGRRRAARCVRAGPWIASAWAGEVAPDLKPPSTCLRCPKA
jgi:nucleotide-binding universal stress UspA family protein